MNPQHTIPVLDDNGTIVTDSHAICAYLSEKYGQDDKLYPKDLAARALVDSRMHFDSGFLFGRIRFLFEPILYFNSPELPQEKIEYIQRSWPIMEAFLERSQFVCGDQLTIADLCCAASVTSVTEIAPIDEKLYPKFVGWLNRMRQLPYFEEVNADGAKLVQDTIRTRVEANREAARAAAAKWKK